MIRNKKNLLVIVGLLVSTASWGQEASLPSFMDNYFQDIVLALLIIILAVFILGALSIFSGFRNVLNNQLSYQQKQKYQSSAFSWKNINQVLTDAVPIEKEKDIMLDHEYDGIRELDNHLPPWWKWLFYLTIVFAIGYLGYYYVLDAGLDQYEIYDKKVAEAKIEKEAFLASLSENIDETNVALTTELIRLDAGQEIFIGKCAVCHGQLGEGNQIGPNLTDQYWLHGGDIKDVFITVKYGIANKMIPWGEQLLPGEMSDVSNFVLSLQGTNPPNGKDAQGELYVASTAEAGAGDAEAVDSIDAVAE